MRCKNGKWSPGRRRGAAQLVLVMLVILVISVATTGAVRRSIGARRMELRRERSLVLEQMLEAAEQWRRAGGQVGAEGVTLRLPCHDGDQTATVHLQQTGQHAVRLTATLGRSGRTIATRSRLRDDP